MNVVYLGKILQAAGLSVIALAYLLAYPSLMSPLPFVVGLVSFVAGWIIVRAK